MKQLIWTLVFYLITVFAGLAQQQMPPIPVDPAVRIGKLDNGLTYYIRQNNLPANQAYFYIVQKVGSIQENEDQRGLAHFLEHMAFNGSKNFPNNETGVGIIPYLESIGVKFGQNLNAATGFDYTIYNIDAVPTRPSTLDSCLLILHDWSSFLLLRDKDIEKERKIIHEEWRTRQNMSLRMLETLLPDIFAGSKYADRLPIGKMEVVDFFKPDVLRSYYATWYRPDLQGLVIVGDVDVDKMEASIKAMFADVQAPVNPAERHYDAVPDNEAPIVSIATDKENPNTQILLFYKRDAVPAVRKVGFDYLVYDFMEDMISMMLQNRLEEKMQEANPPFVYAGVDNGEYLIAQTKDALQLMAIGKPGESQTAIETLIREASRVKRFGFTEGEYERAKAAYQSNLEKRYNERDKQRSSYYVQQYVNHFLRQEPIPDITSLYTTMQQLMPHIPLTAINQVVSNMIPDNNRVLAIMGSTQETYPSKETIVDLFASIDAEPLEAYVDEAITEPLMAEMPTKGRVVKSTTVDSITTWTLSNGATVLVKPTTNKDDEVLISGFALGGLSVIPDKHMPEIRLMSRLFNQITGESVQSIGGVGPFNAVELKKVLAGKNVGMSFSLDAYTQEISGNATVKDLETAMQLLYLNFTAVNANEEAYASFVARNKGLLENFASNPMVVFTDSLMSAAYGNNPRARFITTDDVVKADYATMLSLYKARFANAAPFTFTFVGNVNLDSLKPLVEQYIASLPGEKAKASINKKSVVMKKGRIENRFTRALETPKASIGIIHSGKLPHTLPNLVKLDAFNQLLDILFTEQIREKLGGTYGVQVSASAEKWPTPTFSMEIVFDTEPARREELVNAINAILDELVAQGPTEKMVTNVKEFMVKQHADNLKRNGYIQQALRKKAFEGVDIEKGYTQAVGQLSSATLKAFAKQLFGQNNRVEVVMSSTL